MTATAVIEIVKWGAELIKTVVDAISEAVKGPEPPTLDALKAKIIAAIEARNVDWIADARKTADEALAKAAADAFGDDTKP
jgi:hypothetical protein